MYELLVKERSVEKDLESKGERVSARKTDRVISTCELEYARENG